jgi:glutamate synthase (NADPH/NADH) small chain
VNVAPPPSFEPIPGTEAEYPCDLVLLAMGFTGPVRNGLLDELEVKLDARGNVKTGADCMTSEAGIFAAGDMRRGQSLVVWAIAEGRKAARGVDQWLMGATRLP